MDINKIDMAFKKCQEAVLVLMGTDNNKAAYEYWNINYDNCVEKVWNSILSVGLNPLFLYSDENKYQLFEDIECRSLEKALCVDDAFRYLNVSQQALSEVTLDVANLVCKNSYAIGLHGPIGSGKDTLADQLVTQGYFKIAYADALRCAASVLYSIPMEFFTQRNLKDQPLKALNGYSPRKVLQLFGTEVIRSCLDNPWVKKVSQIISANHIQNGNGFQNVIIPDVRFDDEAAYIRSDFKSGFICMIHRAAKSEDELNKQLGNSHASECGISQHNNDLHLYNNGTLEDYLRESLNLINTTTELHAKNTCEQIIEPKLKMRA